jgi:hypothetical protein
VFDENAVASPVGQRALHVRKSDFGLMFSWMKIQQNNLLFLIFTGKKNPLFWFCWKKIDFYRYFMELSCGAFLLCITFVYSFCV